MIQLLHNKNPAYLSNDLIDWSKSSDDPNMVAKLLGDYDIKGKHIPHWVRICTDLYISGEISQDDFSNMLKHLSQKNLLA